MESKAADHEIVSIYAYGSDQIDRLMTEASECVLMWGTRDGWPVGVVHAFLWQDGKVWLTFVAHRHRAAAIRRDPRVSVCVSAVTTAGMKGAATLKGRARIHEDDETKAWFYPAFAAKVSPNSRAGQQVFIEQLDTPTRVILEVTPEKWITFDGEKSERDFAGELSEEERTPRLESDAVRMNAERARRGLPPR